jgi:hypothetical protein
MPLLQHIAIAVFFLWMFVDAVVVFRHKTGEAENRDRSSFRVLTTMARCCGCRASSCRTRAMAPCIGRRHSSRAWH